VAWVAVRALAQRIELRIPEKPADVVFRPAGKMIGSLTYGHVVFDVNYKPFFDTLTLICTRFHNMSTKTYEVTWREGDKIAEEYKGWAVHRFDATIRDLNIRCQEARSGLHQIFAAWGGSLERAHTPFSPGSVQTKRKRRSVRRRQKRVFPLLLLKNLIFLPKAWKTATKVARVAAGVFAVGSALFSGVKLARIIGGHGSQAETETIRFVPGSVADAALRIDTRDLTALGEWTRHIAWDLERSLNYNPPFQTSVNRLDAALAEAALLLSRIEDLSARSRESLTSLVHYRLHPQLVEIPEVSFAVRELANNGVKLGLVHIMDSPADAYKLQTSHVIFPNLTIRVVVHVPMYRADGVMELFRLIMVPHRIEKKMVVHPSPREEMLAVGRNRQTFRPLSLAQLLECQRFSDIYYCPRANRLEKGPSASCLAQIFRSDLQQIREKCPFQVTQVGSNLAQINATSFLLYHHKYDDIEISCPGMSTRFHQAFKGLREVYLDPGCRALTPQFVFEGAVDPVSPANEIVSPFTPKLPLIGTYLSTDLDDFSLEEMEELVGLQGLQSFYLEDLKQAERSSGSRRRAILVTIVVLVISSIVLALLTTAEARRMLGSNLRRIGSVVSRSVHGSLASIRPPSRVSSTMASVAQSVRALRNRLTTPQLPQWVPRPHFQVPRVPPTFRPSRFRMATPHLPSQWRRSNLPSLPHESSPSQPPSVAASRDGYEAPSLPPRPAAPVPQGTNSVYPALSPSPASSTIQFPSFPVNNPPQQPPAVPQPPPGSQAPPSPGRV